MTKTASAQYVAIPAGQLTSDAVGRWMHCHLVLNPRVIMEISHGRTATSIRLKNDKVGGVIIAHDKLVFVSKEKT